MLSMILSSWVRHFKPLVKTSGEELAAVAFSPPEAWPKHLACLMPAVPHTLVFPDLVVFLLSPPTTSPPVFAKPMLSSSKKTNLQATQNTSSLYQKEHIGVNSHASWNEPWTC